MLRQSERKKADISAFCLLVDLTRFVYRVVEREMWGWASWMADVFFCACFLMFVSCVFFGVLCLGVGSCGSGWTYWTFENTFGKIGMCGWEVG